MAEAVHKTGNVVLIDTYAQKTALRLGVSPESVRAEFAKSKTTAFQVPDPEDDDQFWSPRPDTVVRPSPHEFHLLKLLLLHEELVAPAALHLDPAWIQNPLARQIISQRFAAQTGGTWQSLAAFLDECESPAARSLITEAVAEERKIPNPELQLSDLILKLRNQFLDRQIAALTQKISQPQLDDAEKIGLMREHQKLREQKRAPLSPLHS